jgi:hypothetical protein
MFVEEAGETILFDPSTGEISLLNPSATYLLNLLDGSKTLEQMAEEMAGHFDGVEYTDAITDVATFINQLSQNHFLV